MGCASNICRAPTIHIECSHNSHRVVPLWSRVIPLWNRATPPLMVLLPLYPFYPTSEGALATEFGPFYHRIRTVT